MKSRMILATVAAVFNLTGCQDRQYVESTGDRRMIEGVKDIFGLALQASKNVAADPQTGLSLKAEGAFRDYVQAQCAHRASIPVGSPNYDREIRFCSERLWQERTFAERGEALPPREPLDITAAPQFSLDPKAEETFRGYVQAQCAYRAYSWRESPNYDKALRTCTEQLRQERSFAERGQALPTRGALAGAGAQARRAQKNSA